MPHGDCAAIDIDFVVTDAECFHETQHHRSECFIAFEEVDIGRGHAGALQRLLNGKGRPCQHDGGFGSDRGKALDARARLAIEHHRGLGAADQNRRGAIHNAG